MKSQLCIWVDDDTLAALRRLAGKMEYPTVDAFVEQLVLDLVSPAAPLPVVPAALSRDGRDDKCASLDPPRRDPCRWRTR